LLYNNTIAKTVEGMGYKGIYTEGVEKILGEKSPNFIYTPKGAKKIRVLLRNYKLTDDVGFRFSARWWPEWPLTADKYAGWLATTKGECINIFPTMKRSASINGQKQVFTVFSSTSLMRYLSSIICRWLHPQKL